MERRAEQRINFSLNEEAASSDFNLRVGGKSFNQINEQFTRGGISAWFHAREILSRITSRKQPREEVGLAFRRLTDLGFGALVTPTTSEIYEKAAEKGLELCPPQTAAYLRLAMDQEIDTEVVVAAQPQNSSDGEAHLFLLGRDEGGSWIDTHKVDSETKWSASETFVFKKAAA